MLGLIHIQPCCWGVLLDVHYTNAWGEVELCLTELLTSIPFNFDVALGDFEGGAGECRLQHFKVL